MRDGTFSTLDDHSHDAYVLSTSTPNDVVQAARIAMSQPK